MRLPCDMGNAGDLLKHAVLAEFVRWRCESGSWRATATRMCTTCESDSRDSRGASPAFSVCPFEASIPATCRLGGSGPEPVLRRPANPAVRVLF